MENQRESSRMERLLLEAGALSAFSALGYATLVQNHSTDYVVAGSLVGAGLATISAGSYFLRKIILEPLKESQLAKKASKVT